LGLVKFSLGLLQNGVLILEIFGNLEPHVQVLLPALLQILDVSSKTTQKRRQSNRLREKKNGKKRSHFCIGSITVALSPMAIFSWTEHMEPVYQTRVKKTKSQLRGMVFGGSK